MSVYLAKVKQLVYDKILWFDKTTNEMQIHFNCQLYAKQRGITEDEAERELKQFALEFFGEQPTETRHDLPKAI